MADTGIFATTAEVIRKIGSGGDATQILEATINDFMTQAESCINVDSEFNWSDVYSALNVDVQGILKMAASNLAAYYSINNNPNSWTVDTSTFKLNALWNGYLYCIKILRETDKGQIFTREA